MAHPVINGNWLRRHLPTNQQAAATAWGGVTPPTAAQIAARNADPTYIPPIDQIFDVTINPNTGLSFRTGATNCVNVIRRILRTQIPSPILDNALIRSNLHAYVTSVEQGVVATVTMCTLYGYNQTWSTEKSSWNGRLTLLAGPTTTEAEKSFFARHGQALLDYLFNWIIPTLHTTITVDDILRARVDSFTTTVTRSNGRASAPMWSLRYMNSILNRLTGADSAICNGHFWEYALILDSIIPGFCDKVTRNSRGRGRRAAGPRQHFLHVTENMQASFDANPKYW